MLEKLIESILRPGRAEYSVAELGPAAFLLGNTQVVRTDFQVRSSLASAINLEHMEL